jgi:purine-binding chemotaxis protein CheW
MRGPLRVEKSQTAAAQQHRNMQPPPPAGTTTKPKETLMSKEMHIVGFRVGREVFGVPISLVHEIVRVPEITSVPDSPGCVQGVINLRGKIVSVVDLRRRFGEKEIQPTKKNRILVTEVEGKLVGLIVDSASEVLKIPESDIELPPVFDQGEVNYVTGVGKLNGRLIILIDLNRILQKGELRRIAETSEPRAAAAFAGL